MAKKIIKRGKVSAQVEKEQSKEEFGDDLKSYFGERDKTKRGLEGKSDALKKDADAELEVKEILYQASLKEIPLPKGVCPTFSGLFVTAKRNMVKTTSGIIIAQEGANTECDYQEEQTIMGIGAQVANDVDGIRVGWKVILNMERFRNYRAEQSGAMHDKVNKTTDINVPIVRVNNVEYILITDRDVKYISNNGK